MKSDWHDLVSRRRVKTAVRMHGIRATALNKLALSQEEGSNVPGVMSRGQRVDKKEAWEVWVMEEADREGILKVMNRWVSGYHQQKFEQVERARRECEELKVRVWLEPIHAMLQRKTHELWTDKYRHVTASTCHPRLPSSTRSSTPSSERTLNLMARRSQRIS